MGKIKIPTTEVDYKKLHLVRGDCLAVKRPKKIDDWEWSRLLLQLGEDIANTIGVSMVVFGVERNWNEIMRVDEKLMESYGWVRKDRVFAFKDESFEQIADKYSELEEEE